MAEPYLVIVLAGDEFCLPAAVTREVVPSVEPRRLPVASPTLVGIVSVRGALLPVHDLGRALGLDPSHGRIVIVDDEGPVGLAVDDVRELVQGADEAFVAVPAAGDLIDSALPLGDRIVLRLRTPLGLSRPA